MISVPYSQKQLLEVPSGSLVVGLVSDRAVHRCCLPALVPNGVESKLVPAHTMAVLLYLSATVTVYCEAALLAETKVSTASVVPAAAIPCRKTSSSAPCWKRMKNHNPWISRELTTYPTTDSKDFGGKASLGLLRRVGNEMEWTQLLE
jgi:hypothetical protein